MSDYINRARAFWGRRGKIGKTAIIVVAVLVALAFIGALIPSESDETASTTTVTTEIEVTQPEPPPPPPPPPPPELDENERAVTASDYGEAWPLMVASGTLRCDDYSMVTFTTPDGDTYAVNGLAVGVAEERGWIKEIDPIWKDDPELAGLKVSIGPLIDDGLALCDP